jgi:hypothetical protein
MTMKANKTIMINYSIDASEQEIKFLLSGLRYLLASELYSNFPSGNYNEKEMKNNETERKQIDQMIGSLEIQLKKKV